MCDHSEVDKLLMGENLNNEGNRRILTLNGHNEQQNYWTYTINYCNLHIQDIVFIKYIKIYKYLKRDHLILFYENLPPSSFRP